ncbi:MAG: hypothetical protein AVDCRST_MAG59-161 [uncultured Thermomicrobiales bacterium]|uniref:Uncharacterized protein n=1 Tax=uncultured Thermomicrobiales bacterium TaxID=1645740 RepID=A0A6J4TXN5_9BACT|nr:MAG: hypothetical protein AVDCRST_MAG59-161 [uncultured Thermomicrobiales bacterium]
MTTQPGRSLGVTVAKTPGRVRSFRVPVRIGHHREIGGRVPDRRYIHGDPPHRGASRCGILLGDSSSPRLVGALRRRLRRVQCVVPAGAVGRERLGEAVAVVAGRVAARGWLVPVPGLVLITFHREPSCRGRGGVQAPCPRPMTTGTAGGGRRHAPPARVA